MSSLPAYIQHTHTHTCKVMATLTAEGAMDIPTEGATDIPMEEGTMDILTEGATVILMEVTHILTTFTTLTTHTHPILTLTVALVILKSCKVCTAISSDLVATSNYTHCVGSCFPCFNIGLPSSLEVSSPLFLQVSSFTFWRIL